MEKQTIKEADVSNKVVLLRVDFNVPLLDNGEIEDDTRIVNTLPTIHYLLGRNAKIVIMAHLGRPGGKRDDSLTLFPVAERLAELLDKPEIPVFDLEDSKLQTHIKQMKADDIIMLENIRFYPGETKDFMNFSKKLASLGDLFVNDAFGVSHRIPWLDGWYR